MNDKELTQKVLREYLHYNLSTGIFTWKSKRPGITIGSKAGTALNGYIAITLFGKRYLAHRLAFLYVEGYIPQQVDHEDRVRNHNWWDNLRVLNQSGNIQNASLRSDNKSSVVGVSFVRMYSKWIVTIKPPKYKNKCIGLFTDFTEAVCYRLAAEQCLEWNNSSSSALKYVNEVRCV